jgi:hypothetical protein
MVKVQWARWCGRPERVNTPPTRGTAYCFNGWLAALVHALNPLSGLAAHMLDASVRSTAAQPTILESRALLVAIGA